MNEGRWQFWIDRGGTFTDVVGQSPEGALSVHKLLSDNPERYRDAAVEGMRTVLRQSGRSIDEETPLNKHIAVVKMGTTVATNALLERKGDAVALLITRGFGDLLRIGYQHRPKLFDLRIRLPELLYQRVIEIEERMNADGRVEQPLDQEATRRSLQQVYDHGIRSIAIAFAHGYRYPEHEQMTATIARKIGFTQIFVSHRTSPLIKLISRGDTTVVDAYLSPILRRYVEQVSTEIAPTTTKEAAKPAADKTTLMFMQSHGGLTDAALFRGKDAIVSGPAGGVVGMAQVAEQAGFDRVIGFDMGGTSTDVCHYVGQFERSLETEVAGVRMRTPMMHIHTVAAGGGSILHFSQRRLQVGPESAGADPGPACYRRGGPLSVTDANLLLGRVQAAKFPHVFGEHGDQPLDELVVREKFSQLAIDIAQQTGQPLMPIEQLAEGFLTIAIENMANAIKKISVQRGYDVTRYVLNCFGGAGGQHACAVADALGMETVLLHPFAGVLSALGMGMADIRVLREQQADVWLDDVQTLAAAWAQLDQQATAEVTQQGVDSSAVRIERTAHIRTPGAHQSLPVAYGDAAQMRTAFLEQHQQLYGYRPTRDVLLLDIIASEAIGEMKTGWHHPVEEQPQPTMTHETVAMYIDGAWHQTALVDRHRWSGEPLEGPCLIIEATGTNMVAPGWRAERDRWGNLVLKRYRPRRQTTVAGIHADPIMLEVFNNLFMSIAEQMGAVLTNTAYSVNIKERLDFSCAIFDHEANLVANAPHMPVHLGSMGESVRCVLRDNADDLRPGDVFMLNNPFNGGTHLPDVTVVTPVFDCAGKEIIFVVASRGHHADIGGKTPGSAPPDSRHIAEEGVLIDNFLLVRDGQFREQETRALLTEAQYPCRNIEENIADLVAQVAANATGVAELKKMVDHFGPGVVLAYMRHVQDNAEESVRLVLDVLKDGQFTHRLDDGSAIRVAISVDQQARTAIVDFTGTSWQNALNYNAPRAVCRAAVLYVFRTLVTHDIPLNEGCLKPITLIIPEGSMINPRYPAAVIAGNTEVSQAITECLYGALGIMGGSQGTMNNFVYGNERYQNYETICGGTGAGKGFDGTSAVHSHMTNTRMTDPEILENRYPVLVERFGIRRGSGGAGQYRGGDGAIRRLRFDEAMQVTVLSSHRKNAPYGMAGGMPGAVGINRIERATGEVIALAGNDQVAVETGDIFHMETPGGGGFGEELGSDKDNGDEQQLPA